MSVSTSPPERLSQTPSLWIPPFGSRTSTVTRKVSLRVGPAILDHPFCDRALDKHQFDVLGELAHAESDDRMQLAVGDRCWCVHLRSDVDVERLVRSLAVEGAQVVPGEQHPVERPLEIVHQDPPAI